MRWHCMALCAGLIGCSGGESPSEPSGDESTEAAVPAVPTGPRPDPVADATEAEAIPLWTLDFAELELAGSSRPAPPARLPVEGPWEYTGTTKRGMHRFERPLPFRPRGLFFNTAEPGLTLYADGEAVRYDRFGSSDTWMWFHDSDTMLLYAPERTEPPAGTLELEYDKATRRERALNYDFARADHEGSLEPADFAWTTIQTGWESRRGLLLPAPSTASWTVDVPPAAELHFTSGIVEPELMDGTTSDGATLIVEVTADGQPTELVSAELAPARFVPHRLDLSKWAGQQITLTLRTEGGESPHLDYAFVAEPVLASRKGDPRRVVMVFIDTLRPDRMSLYGYERDTSAELDAQLDGSSVIFENARTVAPWTLPSGRTIVTGRQPEDYGRAQTVQGLLRDRGWATAFLAGNVYLSANFDMHRDWDLHTVALWPPAEQMTDAALAWLEAHDGRDAVLQVHYMDPHLPYVEPDEYRTMYADAEPKGGLRDEFHLSDVKRANLVKKGETEAMAWISDRYDNNVRYVTDEVARLLEQLDDDDIVLLYSDHGEELFDHKAFEHGHTLFDELLRVPLVLKAPGFEAQRIDTAVSLLDLAPTVLDLVDVEAPPEMEGRSLLGILEGDTEAIASFHERDLVFGRPLYGMERWGVLHGTHKYTTHEGREAMYDVMADPGENQNLIPNADAAAGADYRDVLGGSLGRDVMSTWRLATTPFRGRSAHELWVMCTVPGGFEHAWPGAIPLMNAEITIEQVPADQVRGVLDEHGFSTDDHPTASDSAGVIATWQSGLKGAGEVFLVPERDMGAVGHDLRCSGLQNDKRATMRIPELRDPALSEIRTPFDRIQFENSRQLLLQYGIAPLPGEGSIEGRDDEMTDALKAMGYVDDDE